jgi:pimeloyl-ACP methyl ester carboxylesterase
MPSATLNGVNIAYDDLSPPGPPERTILLLHGFASNRHEGWQRTGWYQALNRRGFRVIAMDQRGHGESLKSHDPADYGRAALAADAVALLDHLGVRQPEVFGYSMGTRTALQMAIVAPERVNNLMLGGIGGKLFEPRKPDPNGETIATAMAAEDPASIKNEFLKSFRQFADEQGEDRKALAAFSQVSNPPLDQDAMRRLDMPVFVVAGAGDEGAGDPQGLANMFPHGHSKTIPGVDHFSAIPHALTKAAVFDFLDGLLDDDFPPFE